MPASKPSANELTLLASLVAYEPATGVFSWRQKPSRCTNATDPVGTVNHRGHLVIMLRGQRYRAHYLAWYFATGQWPGHGISHANGNPSDNRLANLQVGRRAGPLEMLRLNDGLRLRDPRGKFVKYEVQRRFAAKRGIEWEFTFAEWVKVWNDSGKWGQRGTRAGCYCMARYGDTGPYSAANVRIIPTADNSREASAKRAANRGQGFTFHPANPKKPYVVEIAGRVIGRFASPAEAVAARDAHFQERQAS